MQCIICKKEIKYSLTTYKHPILDVIIIVCSINPRDTCDYGKMVDELLKAGYLPTDICVDCSVRT